MKMKTANFIWKFQLFSILLASAIGAAAQSGRTTAPPVAPTSTATQPNSSVAPPVLTANADEYKLVFPAVADAKDFYSYRDYIGYRRGITANINSFVAEMNLAGARGYRLVSAVRDKFISLMRLDEGEYEYRFFELSNDSSRRKTDFDEKHAELVRQGFRFVVYYQLFGRCSNVAGANGKTSEECEYANAFFYERDNNAKRAAERQLLLVAAFDSAGKQPESELTTQLNAQLSNRFYPAGILSPFEMLLQQTTDKDDLSGEKPEVQVVVGKQRGDEVLKRANVMAQQGYRIGLAKNGVVVMYRHNQNNTPTNYVWLQARRRNIDKELAKLQAQNVVYRKLYLSEEEDYENWLVFEKLTTNSDERRREYKALQFYFVLSENKIEYKSYMDLTAKSKETLKLMNELVKDGFKAKDLFITGKNLEYITTVLLERERN